MFPPLIVVTPPCAYITFPLPFTFPDSITKLQPLFLIVGVLEFLLLIAPFFSTVESIIFRLPAEVINGCEYVILFPFKSNIISLFSLKSGRIDSNTVDAITFIVPPSSLTALYASVIELYWVPFTSKYFSPSTNQQLSYSFISSL